MLITAFAAGAFATNCYIVAPQRDSRAVIIDPGQDAAPGVREVLNEYGLTPKAVLLTHGHLDHTWNAATVCAEFDIPAYIHSADRQMLADPASGIGPALAAMIGDLTFEEPDEVIELDSYSSLSLAGITFSVEHAPGHSPGSVLFSTTTDIDGTTVPVCFAGDVLFAGSIGRTDLPGGDHQQLLSSIAATLLVRSDDTAVLPGHGPQTTIGAERASNPFLAGLSASDSATSAVKGTIE